MRLSENTYPPLCVLTPIAFCLLAGASQMALPLCKVAENLRGNHGKIKYSKKKKKKNQSVVAWFPGVGNGNPLQYPCLENPKDRGVWWAQFYW